MRYFQFFPTVSYQFSDSQQQTYAVSMTNITNRVILRDRLLAQTSSFYDYIIPSHHRPDTVAVSLYGNAAYTWIVLLMNNIYSLFDWPLTPEEFDAYLVNKYGSYARAAQPTDTEYYFDAAHTPVTRDAYNALDVAERGDVLPAKYFYHQDGSMLNALTYAQLPAALQGAIETAAEYELRVNEQKRRIKVLRSEFLPRAEEELKKVFRSVQ